MENFKKPEYWTDLVQTGNTFEAYEGIVKSMFSDGIINRGRLYVLTAYTKDVCSTFPEIHHRVLAAYLNFMMEVRSRSFESLHI